MGYLLFNHGRTEEAVSQYDAFLTLDTSPINRLLTAGGTVDATKSLVLTSFFLDDQGQNNADVMRRPGRICRGSDVMAKRTGTESGNVFGKLQPRSDGRLRTGFLSAYFRDHTIERLNLGRIQDLDRTKFAVTALSASGRNDAVSAQFRAAADRYRQIPRDIAAARATIADQDLDILIFADSNFPRLILFSAPLLRSVIFGKIRWFE